MNTKVSGLGFVIKQSFYFQYYKNTKFLMYVNVQVCLTPKIQEKNSSLS